MNAARGAPKGAAGRTVLWRANTSRLSLNSTLRTALLPKATLRTFRTLQRRYARTVVAAQPTTARRKKARARDYYRSSLY